MTGPFIIPDRTLDVLRRTPIDRPLALLLRHSARGPIPPGEPGNDVLLTEEGKALARDLGVVIGERLRTLHASPVQRCVDTATALAAGACTNTQVVEDRLLGHPGVYVVEGGSAWTTWQQLGHERVMAHLVAGDRLDGLADPVPASQRLVDHMLARAGGEPGVHVFVTHDSLVTTAAAHSLRQTLGKPDWPWYLEALAVVDEGHRATASYRGWSAEIRWA